MFPTPKELDAQSRVHIDRWIDVDSVECKEIDDGYDLTKKIIRLLFDKEPAYLFADQRGYLWGKGDNGYSCSYIQNKRDKNIRYLWGKGDNGYFYPFYFEYKNKNIGYRLSKKAAN